MYYWLLDTDFNIVAGIDRFQSMIWHESYNEIGDFELYLPADEESVKLYTKAATNGYYIIRSEDAADTKVVYDNTGAQVEAASYLPIMVVDEVKTDLYVKNGDYIIVTGSQAKSLLNRRCAFETDISGDPQTVLRQLVQNNAITPDDPDRQIPRLYLGKELGDTAIKEMLVNYALNGEYLSTICQNVCKENKLGWDLVLDYINNRLLFVITNGKNRTQSQPGDIQTWNSPVTFSIKNQNLVRTTYDLDYENYRNVAIVRKDYEEYNKKTKSVDTIKNYVVAKPYKLDRRPVGLNRYELYFKEDTATISNSEEVINSAVLYDQMAYKGRVELDKYKKKIEVSGEVEANVTFIYGKHYHLGDLVAIKNEYNQTMEARITSVTISLAYNKNQTVPSFVIENYEGKEEEEKDKLKDNELRSATNSNGELMYRCCSEGTLRKIATGYKFSGRVTTTGEARCASYKDGGVTRIDDRSVTKSEAFDDDKYSQYYQGG